MISCIEIDLFLYRKKPQSPKHTKHTTNNKPNTPNTPPTKTNQTHPTHHKQQPNTPNTIVRKTDRSGFPTKLRGTPRDATGGKHTMLDMRDLYCSAARPAGGTSTHPARGLATSSMRLGHSWHFNADADHQRRQQQLQQQRWAQEDRPSATSWHFATGSYVGTGDPGL